MYASRVCIVARETVFTISEYKCNTKYDETSLWFSFSLSFCFLRKRKKISYYVDTCWNGRYSAWENSSIRPWKWKNESFDEDYLVGESRRLYRAHRRSRIRVLSAHLILFTRFFFLHSSLFFFIIRYNPLGKNDEKRSRVDSRSWSNDKFVHASPFLLCSLCILNNVDMLTHCSL